MTKNKAIMDELQQVMTQALVEMKRLTDADLTQSADFLSLVNLFLLGVISTAADLASLNFPGAAPLIYAEVEAAAKNGGLHAIQKIQSENGSRHYSVSSIAPNDMETAMNYLGQSLSTALYKGLYELPMPLRLKPEVLLRAVETLLTNLLSQKFNQFHPHQILGDFCDHVHQALNSLNTLNPVK